jgi:hypothetical protein
MFTVQPQVAAQRMKICRSCKWFKPETGSCGTLILGNTVEADAKENTVTHYRKKIRLCGCVMKVKTKLLTSECPAGKWGKHLMSDEDMQELREFVTSIGGAAKLDSDQVRKLYKWKGKLTGIPQEVSFCSSCVASVLKELKTLFQDEE